MGTFAQSVQKILKNAGKSFLAFPVVMLSAALFTIVSIIRTAMDYPFQEPYNFLFNTMQFALALGAIAGLAAITYAQSRIKTRRSFWIANLLGLIVAVAAFLLLYFAGGYTPEKSYYQDVVYKSISMIASVRVTVAIFLSLLAFVLFAARKKEDRLNFSGAVFMTLKAFFIALIYGLVIMGGASGVFGAIKALLYTDLTSKVFGYVGALSGFFGFAIFVGYFPDFRKDGEDEQRVAAQKQPRFIEILLEYILVPIMLALTVVLVLWAIRTITGGMETQFINLYSIAASYAIGGLLLHILVTHNQSGLTKFYRRAFPFAALFMLLFEAWALITSLREHGLKTTEYVFIIIGLVTFISAIMLIIKQERAHPWIVYVVSVLAVVAVLPVIGFHALPYSQQVNRLERILMTQDMLQNNKIVPAKTEPSLAVREDITEAVDFLIYEESRQTPAWLDTSSIQQGSFKSIFGFERVFPNQDPAQKDDFQYTMLNLEPQAIDVSAYQWELTALQTAEKYNEKIVFAGLKGEYTISWTSTPPSDLPNIEVLLNNKSIIKGDLSQYMESLIQKYPLGSSENPPANLTDMTYRIESEDLELILVFNQIRISSRANSGERYYGVSLQAIYLNEK